MYLRLVRIQAMAVVPEPMNGSNTSSSSCVHVSTWSMANCVGNGAGCFTPLKLVVYFQMLVLGDLSGTGFFSLPEKSLCPAHLFTLSHIRFAVGLPFEKINIYSKICVYLLLFLLAGKVELFFSNIIVSCRFKPNDMKCSACLKLLPVSVPLITASPTTQTITPEGLMMRTSSFAIDSNGNTKPSYSRRLSYGGDVKTISTDSSASVFIRSMQSPLNTVFMLLLLHQLCC